MKMVQEISPKNFKDVETFKKHLEKHTYPEQLLGIRQADLLELLKSEPVSVAPEVEEVKDKPAPAKRKSTKKTEEE